jgi:hypothetical protein
VLATQGHLRLTVRERILASFIAVVRSRLIAGSIAFRRKNPRAPTDYRASILAKSSLAQSETFELLWRAAFHFQGIDEQLKQLIALFGIFVPQVVLLLGIGLPVETWSCLPGCRKLVRVNAR